MAEDGKNEQVTDNKIQLSEVVEESDFDLLDFSDSLDEIKLNEAFSEPLITQEDKDFQEALKKGFNGLLEKENEKW